MVEDNPAEQRGDDRRAHPRHFMHVFISVVGRRDELQVEAHGVTVNISLGGVLALLDAEIPIGDGAVCEVRFKDAGDVVSPEVCSGVPLRSEKRDPDHELAIEFDAPLDLLVPPEP